MIDQFFEPFTLLTPACIQDGLGGTATELTPFVAFRGALTQIAAQEQDTAGRMSLRSRPVLLHDFDVTLRMGDRVRREKDGAIYRVAGRPEDMRTPAFSSLRFAQVPVERWDHGC